MTEEECETTYQQASLRKRALFGLALLRTLPRLSDFPVIVTGLPFVEMVADMSRPSVPHLRQLKSLRLRAQQRLLQLNQLGSTDPSADTVSWLFQFAAGFDEHGYFLGFAKHLLHDSADSMLPSAEEIFGNPFRPVTFDPLWRSETATALAAGIYEERAFDRLPILADALEEAGCDHPDVLNHLRGSGPHARGCWVVDGVLGKE